MDDVLQYLEMKNHYYEKFFALSKKFLDQISKNQWDDLEYFVDNRERILSIIRSFDFQISKSMEGRNVSDSEASKYKENVEALLGKRTELAAKIVALDLELISKIDEYKSDTIKDLKKTVETQQHVATFTKAGPRKTLKSA